MPKIEQLNLRLMAQFEAKPQKLTQRDEKKNFTLQYQAIKAISRELENETPEMNTIEKVIKTGFIQKMAVQERFEQVLDIKIKNRLDNMLGKRIQKEAEGILKEGNG